MLLASFAIESYNNSRKKKIERKKERVHGHGTKLERVEPNKHSLVHTNNCFV